MPKYVEPQIRYSEKSENHTPLEGMEGEWLEGLLEFMLDSISSLTGFAIGYMDSSTICLIEFGKG
jgi:hypothetical protein